MHSHVESDFGQHEPMVVEPDGAADVSFRAAVAEEWRAFPFWRLPFGARLRIPHPDRAILAGGRNLFFIGREQGGPHKPTVSAQRRARLARRHVPHARRVVVRGG